MSNKSNLIQLKQKFGNETVLALYDYFRNCNTSKTDIAMSIDVRGIVSKGGCRVINESKIYRCKSELSVPKHLL